MGVLKIRNANGEWIDIPAIKGKDGKDGEVTLEQLKNITGELDDLSTEDKSNLVNAINEIFEGGNSYLPFYSITLNDSMWESSREYSLTSDERSLLKDIIQEVYDNGYNNFLLNVYGTGSKRACLFYMTSNDVLQSKPTFMSLFGFAQGYNTNRFDTNRLAYIGYYQITLNMSWNENEVSITNGKYFKTDVTLMNVYNTYAYTPTGDYNPATKKYVDDAIDTAITTVLEGEY